MKLKAGIVGTGVISGIYLENGSKFDSLEITACADLERERAEARAAEYGVKACGIDELMRDPDIDMIINLTVPQAHADVSIQALEAGKHVYLEKPLAVELEDAGRVMELARSKGLRVGCAPDTFLGGGVQTCVKAINDGLIGTPIGATAFHVSGGPENWHPMPDFFFKRGGGPMFDMGPYYVTALVALLGPIDSVTGYARISYPERIVAKTGRRIQVETPTHISGAIRFAQGAVGTIVTSFDAEGGASLPPLEVYGSEGSLRVPDPSSFGGPVLIRSNGESEWREIPIKHKHTRNFRSIGAADMAKAILTGRDHRASGELAYHVLEAMHGFLASSERNAAYPMTSSCVKPVSLPEDLAEYTLD